MKIHCLVVGEMDTNCYVVESQKGQAFVIDPGDDAPVIRRFLSAHKIGIRFVVNTHGHIDHIKANAGLQVPVYLHEKEAGMVSDVKKNPMSVFFGAFAPVEPGRRLREGDIVSLDELAFEVIHAPGHTPGGLCLYGHGVLFSGDTLFRDGIGRTDFPGADPDLMEDSLRKLSKLDEKTVVYPGHGPGTTIGREFKGK
jgi:glyoxylase-like metal-dependent hydrolase (beta-lactamase superfamily II)